MATYSPYMVTNILQTCKQHIELITTQYYLPCIVQEYVLFRHETNYHSFNCKFSFQYNFMLPLLYNHG